MKKVFSVCALIPLFAGIGIAQKAKPWTEWSQKEAEKILTDSAWAQTQTEVTESQAATSSASAVTRTQSTNESGRIISSEAARNIESGETIGKRSAALSVNYRVRFLSAKPIRGAFVRMIELQGTAPERVAQLKEFVDRDFGDYIVVTVLVDGTNRAKLGAANQEIAGADEEALKKTTFLETKDGRRVALMNYRPPIQDGLGAKFVFPRTLDGKPFIDTTTPEVRFVTDVGKTVKINRKFKTTDMLFEGKLEY